MNRRAFFLALPGLALLTKLWPRVTRQSLPLPCSPVWGLEDGTHYIVLCSVCGTQWVEQAPEKRDCPGCSVTYEEMPVGNYMLGTWHGVEARGVWR
jgi:hypothetical protein